MTACKQRTLDVRQYMHSWCMINLNPITHYKISPTHCGETELSKQVYKYSPTDTYYTSIWYIKNNKAY